MSLADTCSRLAQALHDGEELVSGPTRCHAVFHGWLKSLPGRAAEDTRPRGASIASQSARHRPGHLCRVNRTDSIVAKTATHLLLVQPTTQFIERV